MTQEEALLEFEKLASEELDRMGLANENTSVNMMFVAAIAKAWVQMTARLEREARTPFRSLG